MSDDYVYDEATGEWLSPAEAAEKAAATTPKVVDSVGNELNDGDAVTLIKDLTALVDQFYAEVQAMGGNRWDTSSLKARLPGPDGA